MQCYETHGHRGPSEGYDFRYAPAYHYRADGAGGRNDLRSVSEHSDLTS